MQEFGGVTVGFVGAVTEELPALVSPAGIADLEVAADRRESSTRVAARSPTATPRTARPMSSCCSCTRARPTTDIASRDRSRRTPFGEIINGVDAGCRCDRLGAHAPGLQLLVPIAQGDRVVSPGQYGERLGDMVSTGRTRNQAILRWSNSAHRRWCRPTDRTSILPLEDTRRSCAVVADAEVARDRRGQRQAAATITASCPARLQHRATSTARDRRWPREPRRRVDARQLRRRRAAVGDRGAESATRRSRS